MHALAKRHTCSPLGHSADVSLWLHVGDNTLSLAQTSRKFLILDRDAQITPGPARVEVIVDGESHFSDVTIVGREPGSLLLDIADIVPVKQAS